MKTSEKIERFNYFGSNHSNETVSEREIIKKPTDRVDKIRNLFFETKSSASVEFTYWYTRKWEELDGEIPIIRRAEALKSGFSHLSPVIYPGELLVMGKASYLRGSYPMPWLSESYFMASEDKMYKEAQDAGKLSSDNATTWGQGGGNVTKSTGNVVSIAGKFGIRREELDILMKTAKKWHNKSVDDVGHKYEQEVPGYHEKEEIMRSLICMFDSGYTLPQGREVVNYYYPLQYGIDGIIEICIDSMKETAGKPEMDRLYFYKAVKIALEGIKKWIVNYSIEAEFLASIEANTKQKSEYVEIAKRLKRLSSEPPISFKDALQLVWIFHCAILNEDAISGLSPGRLGLVLAPYWQYDIDNGIITEEETLELLECMRMKFTEIDCFASMGVVGGVLSGNTFNNLCVGGLTKDNKTAFNELENLIIESGMTCATPQPTLSLLYDEKTPEEYLLKGIECIKTGAGYPAWVNNQIAMEFLLNNYSEEGMKSEEARAWSIGGCLETSPGSWMPLTYRGKTYHIPGGSAPATSVGVHFLSVPKILETVLFNGIDKRTGRKVFEPHGFTLDSFENIWEAFKKYFSRSVEILTLTNNIQHDAWRKISPSLVNSFMKPDCLTNGKDIGNLGCRYNTTFNVEVCGGVTFVNSLASIKKNVFEDKNYTIENYKDALIANFGFKTAQETGSFSLIEQIETDEYAKWKHIHKASIEAPKYGNDNSFADDIYKEWQEWFCDMCHNYRSLYDKPLYACQISVSTHAPMGAVTLATPDGRLCGTTFSDGSVSAYPGTDKNGPYSLLNSAICYDHALAQNSQLNMKIHPSVIEGRQGSKKFLDMIRSYMRNGGFHMQFNIVDSRMLRDAQEHPENYQGLMVRVAGFTQYWAELGKQIQDEVIARTEYGKL